MPVISAANVPPPATRPPLESTVKEPSALLIRPLSLTFNAPSIVVVLTVPNSSVTVSRSMPAIVAPTSLPSSTKDLAVIAPPSIMVWSSAAPTVILLSATTVSPTVMPTLLIIVPPALMVLVVIAPSVTTVLPIVIPSLSNLAMPSIVVVPLPGSPASAGSRSIPPTLSGRFASFKSPAYASKSLIAWPTSLPSKLPKFRLPSTTVLPVAASTVKLP